jgi:hypothetical protein
MGLIRDYFGTDSCGARWFTRRMSLCSRVRVSCRNGVVATVLVMALALAACGGSEVVDGGVQVPDGGDVRPATTSLEDVDEPNPIDVATTESNVDRGAGTLSRVCVDVVITYLRGLEALYPPVPPGADIGELMAEADIDWEEVDRVQARLIEEGERLDCDINREDEALFWEFVEIARREAPGMVDYLEWIAVQAASHEGS